jgi:hypothetical protein
MPKLASNSKTGIKHYVWHWMHWTKLCEMMHFALSNVTTCASCCFKLHEKRTLPSRSNIALLIILALRVKIQFSLTYGFTFVLDCLEEIFLRGHSEQWFWVPAHSTYVPHVCVDALVVFLSIWAPRQNANSAIGVEYTSVSWEQSLSDTPGFLGTLCPIKKINILLSSI